MKTFLTAIAVCLLLPRLANAHTNTVSPNLISLYAVPFVCPAATEIGCGSRTKPILLALEQKTPVAEAWLNRAGTMLAIVWKPEAKKKEKTATINAITKEEEFKAKELRATARKQALPGFLAREGWLRSSDVDRLSEEEAGVIATRWIQRLKAKTKLTEEKAKGLNVALTEALKQVLTGKLTVPETEEGKAIELRRVAGPFLDDKQLEILRAVADCGPRALSGEQ